MNKIGLLTLVFGLVQAYVLSYIINKPYADIPIYLIDVNIINHITLFCYCSGMGLISLYFSKIEKSRWVKYMLWNVIAILGGVMILIYAIDFLIDPLIITSKVIWGLMASAIISLCIYLFKRN